MTDTFRVGAASSYGLGGSGEFSANIESVSGSSAGLGRFTQSGGINRITDALSLSYGGHSLLGGSLSAKRILVNYPAASFDFSGGRLSVESFAGGLDNTGGTLAPGGSPGTTTIDGDFQMSGPAVLEIESGSPTPGSGFDVVSVTGAATLAGLLDVSLLGAFLPTLSDTFDILAAESISGRFGALALPPLGA